MVDLPRESFWCAALTAAKCPSLVTDSASLSSFQEVILMDLIPTNNTPTSSQPEM